MASTTLATYKTRILAQLGLSGDAANWSTILTDWLNEAYEDVLLETRAKVRPATMALTSGEDDYSLPSTPLAIISIRNSTSDQDLRFHRRTPEEIEAFRRIEGSPPGRYYALAGDLLMIWPIPGASETVTVYYVPRPTPLSAVGDIPSDIPAEYHQLLEFYVLARLAMAREHKPSDYGAYWEAKYMLGVRRMRAMLRRRGGETLERVRLERRQPALTSPSQTWD